MTHDDWHIPDPVVQPEFYRDVPAKRFLAWVVDTIVILAICVAILPFTAFTGVFFFPFLIGTVNLAYRIVTIARGSATWGMWLMAIEFRTLSGRRFSLGMATLHTLAFTFCFTIFPVQVVSIVLMLTGARAQGLGDHLLGTIAINRRAAT